MSLEGLSAHIALESFMRLSMHGFRMAVQICLEISCLARKCFIAYWTMNSSGDRVRRLLGAAMGGYFRHGTGMARRGTPGEPRLNVHGSKRLNSANKPVILLVTISTC